MKWEKPTMSAPVPTGDECPPPGIALVHYCLPWVINK
jgi:hypothetical protein